ncbi:hypothetical protein RCG72_004421 [Enterobacter roggenkampii]|nr:hypothetical protein [Enterobacter roggenkampii]
MKEFKGTPGPWKVSRTGKSIGSVSGGDDPSMLLVAWAEPYANPAHQEANANLIAAAPDLLEALLSIVNMEYQPKDDESDNVYLKARAAISKALGED